MEAAAQSEIELFQFELCPFCHKVKAGLEVKGLAYSKVEVNPMKKAELPDLPEDFYVVPRAPHPPLFARCKVIVHHGGAGTTATAPTRP